MMPKGVESTENIDVHTANQDVIATLTRPKDVIENTRESCGGGGATTTHAISGRMHII